MVKTAKKANFFWQVFQLTKMYHCGIILYYTENEEGADLS